MKKFLTEDPKNIRQHRAKFIRLDNLASAIRSPLIWGPYILSE